MAHTLDQYTLKPFSNLVKYKINDAQIRKWSSGCTHSNEHNYKCFYITCILSLEHNLNKVHCIVAHGFSL